MLRQNKEIVQELLNHLMSNPITDVNRQTIADWYGRVIAELDYEKLDEVTLEVQTLQYYAYAAALLGDYVVFDELSSNGLQPPRSQFLITERVQQLASDIKRRDHKTNGKLLATRMDACFSCISKKDLENISVKIFNLKNQLPQFRKFDLKEMNISREIENFKRQATNHGAVNLDAANKIWCKIERLETILTLQAVEVLQTLVWEDFKKSNDALLVNVLVNNNAVPEVLKLQTAKQSLELSKEMKAILEDKSEVERKSFSQKLDAILSGPLAKKHGAFIDALQQGAYDDFIKTHDTAILDVLIKHKMSPLTAQQIKGLLAQALDKDRAAQAAQLVRSANRYHFHVSIFKHAPNTARALSLAAVGDECAKNAIYELIALKYPVINHLVYHWTILPNLRNIVRNNAFYGSEQLQKNGLWFQKNALMEGDILNGDGNVICFCPYFVDYNALIKKNGELKFREDLVRLTIDLSKAQTKGAHNQFFKLFDFAAPSFDNTITIFSDFKVQFQKLASFPSVNVSFYLDDKKYVVTIKKNEAIFYGNLYAINKFCLLKLFDLVGRAKAADSANAQPFNEVFYAYLSKLNADEIKKLLIVFAQNLTIYAEYNFNSTLRLTDHLLTEIYHVATGAKVELQDLSIDDYRQCLTGALKQIPATSDPKLLTLNSVDSMTMYGSKININGYTSVLQQDFRATPAILFGQSDYIETRGNVPTHSIKSTVVLSA